MHFPLFIAKRLYSEQGDKRKVSRPAIHIATAGVAIGLAVMIISVCVVLGFKHTIRDKVIGFGSHIQVADFLTLQQMEQYPIVIDDSMIDVLKHIPDVAHVQRFAMKEGILKTDSDFLGVAFKGVGPEFDSTFIHNNMVEGSIPHFSDSVSHNQILVSQLMADKLHLKSGQRIFAYFFDNNGVRTRRFTIAGIYQTNLKKYDETIVFTDLYTAVKLNGWESDQASGAELSVNNFDNLDMVESRVISKVKGTVDHYGETYSNKTIRHTFLWFAVFIIGKGMLIGNILSLGLLALQQAFGIIKLDAQTYYVSTVPVEINALYIVALNVATLLISVFMLVAPSYLISHIHPAKSMRYE